MKELEDLLLYHHRDFWYDIYNVEKKEVRALKNYIDYVEKELREYRGVDANYKSVSCLFMNKHLDYLREALLSLSLGNYNSFAVCARIMIENYVGFELLKKYRKRNVWKDWYLWSYYKAVKTLESNAKKEIVDKVKKAYVELCEVLGVDSDYITDTNSYGWLKRVEPLKKYNFNYACRLIDSNLYDDFVFYSSYVHNNDMVSKTNWVHMGLLTKFIHFIYEITDRMITSYKYHFIRRSEYHYLCIKLLETLDECNNYNEDIKI